MPSCPKEEGKRERLLAGLGFVDFERAPVEILTVEGFDRGLSFFAFTKGHERESTRTASFAIHGDVDVGDVTVGAEGLTDSGLGGIEGQIADV